MTRINLVHPSELCNKHLVAEKHEITRIPTLARRCQWELHKKKIPSEYTLGTGHCLFFYDKLKFIADRYESLCDEMRVRGYNVTQISRNDLLSGIDGSLHFDYKPTENAINVNRQRIFERMPK